MRRWQSHKVVEAEPIIVVVDANTPACAVWIKESGEGARVDVPASFCARGIPEQGDYLVRYADGYLSWSPKKAFEEGYRCIEPPTVEELERLLAEDGLGDEVDILPDGTVRRRVVTGSILGADGKPEPVEVDPAKVREMMWPKKSEADGESSARDLIRATMADECRKKLTDFLIERIAKHESAHFEDGARLEELAYLLMTAVQGGIV